ncbi:MAG: UrcA family protein, partial [Pseudomonadota bacterium]
TRKDPTMIRTLTTTAIVAAIAAPAFAAASVSIEVPFDPALLDTPKGAEIVYERIETAAEKACDTGVFTDVIREMIAASSCEKLAVEAAVADIDSPALNAVHETRKG